MRMLVSTIWKRLVRSIWKPDMVTGVAVQVAGPASLELHACTLSVFKDKLEVFDKHTGLKNALHFSKQYRRGPLALSIAGKGVLTRKIEQPGPAATVLQKIFPNASAEEFYVQFHQGDEGHYVSLVRRAEAGQLVADFGGYGFKVVSLNLGGFAAARVMRPEAMEEVLQPAYDAAFQVLLLGDDVVEAGSETFLYARKQSMARARVLRTGRLAGLLVVLVLLVNFVLYGYYAGQADRLAVKNKVSGDAAGRLKATEAAILQKAELVRAVGWTGGLNPAFLTDRLLSLVPAGVRVQEFSVNPLKKGSRPAGGQGLYQMGTVEVSGSCEEANALNHWLVAIKSFSWVGDCSIRNYQTSPENGLGIFTVHIQLKDEG